MSNPSLNNINEEIFISKENLNLLLLSYIYFNNEENFSSMKIPHISNKSNKIKENIIKDLNENQNSKINKPEKKLKKSLAYNKNIVNEDTINTNKASSLFNISKNINIEFLQNINVIDHQQINHIGYKNFIIFTKLIEANLKYKTKLIESGETIKDKNLIKFHLSLEDLFCSSDKKNEDFNFFKEKFNGVKNMDNDIILLLDPSFKLKTIIKGTLKDQIVFINQPYEYLKYSDSITGKIKVRRDLCKRLKINFIEYDLYEFLNFSNMKESDFNLNEENFDEYAGKIEEYVTAKNEVFSK